MSAQEEKKRVRVTARAPERHFLGSDEARFRLAARLSSGLGVALLLSRWCSATGCRGGTTCSAPHGNIALRLAGVALIIVSIMFGRLGN